MKPFNLEAAKRGEPVYTRSGRRVYLYTTEAREEHYPVVGCIEVEHGKFTTAQSWQANGSWRRSGEHSHDLFMAPKMRKVRVMVWIDEDGREHALPLDQTGVGILSTKHKIIETEVEEP